MDFTNLKRTLGEKLEGFDQIKPEIHKHACKNCPSLGKLDPEVMDTLNLSHRERVLTAFVCAWRQTKYCKGYCDLMQITPQDIKDRHASEQ